MADTNNQHYVDQYSENVMHLAQRSGSLLWPHIKQKTGVVGKKYSQNQIGEWGMRLKVGRNPETPSSDPKLSRRWGTIKTYQDAVQFDPTDGYQILGDPMSDYTLAGQKAVGRQIDDEIIANILGNSDSGEEGGTNVVLPASQKILHGSTNLTFAKVRQTKMKFNANSVGTNGDIDKKLVFVCSPEAMDNLLAEAQATSSDYTSIQAIQNGDFDGKYWMGFQWIMHPALTINGNIRSNFAFSPYGVCGAMHASPVFEVDRLPGKSYSTQIYYEVGIGCNRLEEKRVVEVQGDES